MSKNTGSAELSCDRCQRGGTTHYRVRSDNTGQWIFVCPGCWPAIHTEPGYCYGGTRKANRRQRKR